MLDAEKNPNRRIMETRLVCSDEGRDGANQGPTDPQTEGWRITPDTGLGSLSML